MLVVLQVRLVFPDVTSDEHKSSKVHQWLTRCILAVEVGGLVLTPWSSWLLGCRSSTSWQLLVEGNNLGHSLGVRVGADVLDVSRC